MQSSFGVSNTFTHPEKLVPWCWGDLGKSISDERWTIPQLMQPISARGPGLTQLKGPTTSRSHRHNRLGRRQVWPLTWPLTRLSPLWYFVWRQCCCTKRVKSTLYARADHGTAPLLTTPTWEPLCCAPKWCTGEEIRRHRIMFLRSSVIAADKPTTQN